MEKPTRDTISLEPHWDGLRRWALNGIRSAATADERDAFDTILNACDEARRAARPTATWTGPTWGPA